MTFFSIVILIMFKVVGVQATALRCDQIFQPELPVLNSEIDQNFIQSLGPVAEDLTKKAKKELGRNLSTIEVLGLIQMHYVGFDELGSDGQPARVESKNYTQAQLRKKMKIGRAVGFKADEIQKLIRSGIVGRLNLQLPLGAYLVHQNAFRMVLNSSKVDEQKDYGFSNAQKIIRKWIDDRGVLGPDVSLHHGPGFYLGKEWSGRNHSKVKTVMMKGDDHIPLMWSMEFSHRDKTSNNVEWNVQVTLSRNPLNPSDHGIYIHTRTYYRDLSSVAERDAHIELYEFANPGFLNVRHLMRDYQFKSVGDKNFEMEPVILENGQGKAFVQKVEDPLRTHPIILLSFYFDKETKEFKLPISVDLLKKAFQGLAEVYLVIPGKNFIPKEVAEKLELNGPTAFDELEALVNNKNLAYGGSIRIYPAHPGIPATFNEVRSSYVTRDVIEKENGPTEYVKKVRQKIIWTGIFGSRFISENTFVDQPTSFYEVTERLTQMETNHKINDLRQKWIQAREQTATAQQSQNTKEEVQRLKEEIAVMNQLLEEAEAQHRTMSDKNKALQEKLDQATIELDASRDQVSYLQEEIRRASKSQYGKEKLEQSKIDTLEFDPKDDLETMLIRIEDANSTKLAFASSVAGSKLKELKNFMMNENNRRILFETLKVMGSELHELYMKGPADIEEEFKSQISTKNRWLNSVRLVRGESNIVKSTNRLARMREGVYGGKVYDGYAHISYGNRNPEMFRIHYSWDFELKRIIVTVVTDHLENGSTQKLK